MNICIVNREENESKSTKKATYNHIERCEYRILDLFVFKTTHSNSLALKITFIYIGGCADCQFVPLIFCGRRRCWSLFQIRFDYDYDDESEIAFYYAFKRAGWRQRFTRFVPACHMICRYDGGVLCCAMLLLMFGCDFAVASKHFFRFASSVYIDMVFHINQWIFTIDGVKSKSNQKCHGEMQILANHLLCLQFFFTSFSIGKWYRLRINFRSQAIWLLNKKIRRDLSWFWTRNSTYWRKNKRNGRIA